MLFLAWIAFRLKKVWCLLQAIAMLQDFWKEQGCFTWLELPSGCLIETLSWLISCHICFAVLYLIRIWPFLVGLHIFLHLELCVICLKCIVSQKTKGGPPNVFTDFFFLFSRCFPCSSFWWISYFLKRSNAVFFNQWHGYHQRYLKWWLHWSPAAGQQDQQSSKSGSTWRLGTAGRAPKHAFPH